MFAQTFGHGTLRKYVIYFGTLFNNINVRRFDQQGTLVQTMKVPLNYGPREKYLARLEGNRDGVREIAIQLPRMSFEMTGLYYDPSRKLNALNRIAAPLPGMSGETQWQYQPVPYNIDFTLSIMTKNVEDGTYIVEQILPYFNPVWTATLNINPELNQRYDVPITLDNITNEDTYEGNFENRRAIIWTLTFTMKAYFFGPTFSSIGQIIRDIDINFRTPPIGVSIDTANTTNTDTLINYNIVPSQTEDGDPLSYVEQNRLYTFAIEPGGDVFEPTTVIGDIEGNKIYVASSNTSSITARRIDGDITPGELFIDGVTGGSVVISSINVEPEDSISSSLIAANSDFGFITDITSDL